MKVIKKILFTCFLLLATLGFSQFNYSKAIKLDVLNLALGQASLQYETALGNRTSFQLESSYVYRFVDYQYRPWFREYQPTKYTGFEFAGSLRLYPDLKILDGFYLGPKFSFKKLKNEYNIFDQLTSSQQKSVVLHFVFGNQFILKEKIPIDLYIGLGYKKNLVWESLFLRSGFIYEIGISTGVLFKRKSEDK